jgi:hypothetical protein
MDHNIYDMAHQSFGYGRWAAPYWFIGPEQGRTPSENNDLKPRVEAWRYLGGGELIDCHAFHDRIGEKRWRVAHPLEFGVSKGAGLKSTACRAICTFRNSSSGWMR